MIIALTISIVKTVYKDIKLSINISNTPKLVMVSASYHDITRLLLLTIIVISKNYMISIIGKGNITVNKQNRLIAHSLLAMQGYKRSSCQTLYMLSKIIL